MEVHFLVASKAARYRAFSSAVWHFYDKDQVKIDTFCGVFGVSRSAAAIRLEQLGYLNRKKDYEYRDPLEVWP